MKTTLIAVILTFLAGIAAVAQDNPALEQEKVAIKKAALDYMEGWYQGSAERMERALHPDFVKRSVWPLPNGRQIVEGLGKNSMVEMTRAGGGTKSPKDKQKCEVTILDIQGTIASAKVVSGDYYEYLHLARTGGGWKILNILWVPLRPLEK